MIKKRSKALEKFQKSLPGEKVSNGNVSAGIGLDSNGKSQAVWILHGTERFFFLYPSGEVESITFSDADRGRIIKLMRNPTEEGQVITEEHGDIKLSLKSQKGDVEMSC